MTVAEVVKIVQDQDTKLTSLSVRGIMLVGSLPLRDSLDLRELEHRMPRLVAHSHCCQTRAALFPLVKAASLNA